MVMTGGWFMTLLYPHYPKSLHCRCWACIASCVRHLFDTWIFDFGLFRVTNGGSCAIFCWVQHIRVPKLQNPWDVPALWCLLRLSGSFWFLEHLRIFQHGTLPPRPLKFNPNTCQLHRHWHWIPRKKHNPHRFWRVSGAVVFRFSEVSLHFSHRITGS